MGLYGSDNAGGSPVDRRWIAGGSPVDKNYMETRFEKQCHGWVAGESPTL